VIYRVLNGPSIVIDQISSEDTCQFVGKNYQEHIDETVKFQCNKAWVVEGPITAVVK